MRCLLGIPLVKSKSCVTSGLRAPKETTGGHHRGIHRVADKDAGGRGPDSSQPSFDYRGCERSRTYKADCASGSARSLSLSAPEDSRRAVPQRAFLILMSPSRSPSLRQLLGLLRPRQQQHLRLEHLPRPQVNRLPRARHLCPVVAIVVVEMRLVRRRPELPSDTNWHGIQATSLPCQFVS
jgi:hypothetical protein